MFSDNLEQVVTRLQGQDLMRFPEPATDDQITLFEKQHGVFLPELFKEWLKFSDGGELYLPASVQFYGVAHKPVIDITDNERPDDSYIVVGALASGDSVLFRKGEDRFYIYEHASQKPDMYVYDDFPALLNALCILLGRGTDNGRRIS